MSTIVLYRRPDRAPAIIPPDAAYRRPEDGRALYVQESLALDFVVADPDFARQPTPADDLPDPQRHARVMAQSLIEVTLGTRPAPQLIRHLTPPLYSIVARRALLAAQRRARQSGRAPVVRTVRVTQPSPAVVEACAVIVTGARARAMAFRMEGLDGRWLVTDLQLG